MSYNLKIGAKGEHEAQRFLENKGYIILETNWRNSHQEVDIIAKLKDKLIFIEVKTRTNLRFGLPEESVTKKKQDLLAEAAEEYIHQKQHKDEIRFDIISILINHSNVDIYHIKDAFFPQMED